MGKSRPTRVSELVLLAWGIHCLGVSYVAHAISPRKSLLAVHPRFFPIAQTGCGKPFLSGGAHFPAALGSGWPRGLFWPMGEWSPESGEGAALPSTPLAGCRGHEAPGVGRPRREGAWVSKSLHGGERPLARSTHLSSEEERNVRRSKPHIPAPYLA